MNVSVICDENTQYVKMLSNFLAREGKDIWHEHPFGFTISVYKTESVRYTLCGRRYIMIYPSKWIYFKPCSSIEVNLEDHNLAYNILCNMSSRAVFDPRKICLSRHLLESELPREISSYVFQLWFDSTGYH